MGCREERDFCCESCLRAKKRPFCNTPHAPEGTTEIYVRMPSWYTPRREKERLHGPRVLLVDRGKNRCYTLKQQRKKMQGRAAVRLSKQLLRTPLNIHYRWAPSCVSEKCSTWRGDFGQGRNLVGGWPRRVNARAGCRAHVSERAIVVRLRRKCVTCTAVLATLIICFGLCPSVCRGWAYLSACLFVVMPRRHYLAS